MIWHKLLITLRGIRWLTLAHGSFMLYTLDVKLVMIEEAVHSVRDLNIATALLLKALFGQRAEVLRWAIRRWRDNR